MENIDLLEKHFGNSLRNVIGTMTGFELEEYEIEHDHEMNCEDQISGVMVLTGNKNAVIFISMAKQTAATVVTYMTGIMPEELTDEEIIDGAAELANMIAGATKPQLAETEYYFSVSSPFALVGGHYHVVHKQRINKIVKKFKNEEIEIYLQVIYI